MKPATHVTSFTKVSDSYTMKHDEIVSLMGGDLGGKWLIERAAIFHLCETLPPMRVNFVYEIY